MAEVAAEVARHGRGPRHRGRACALLEATRALAGLRRSTPYTDLGLGSVHLPELEVVDRRAGRRGAGRRRGSAALLRERCEAGLGRRYGVGTPTGCRGAAGRRARVIDAARLPVLLPHRRRRGRPHPVPWGCGWRPAGSGAGSLVTYLLGISGVDPMPLRPADGAVPVPAAPPAARHRHRRGVRPADRGLRADARSASAATGAPASR